MDRNAFIGVVKKTGEDTLTWQGLERVGGGETGVIPSSHSNDPRRRKKCRGKYVSLMQICEHPRSSVQDEFQSSHRITSSFGDPAMLKQASFHSARLWPSSVSCPARSL